MVKQDTIRLLRFPFSFFLMPVYAFALSQVTDIHPLRAALVFVVLHFLVYPASNGYNSYMDRDEGPIGGLAKPPDPSRELYRVSLVMDGMAILISLLISYFFAAGILLYILASRAYSWRGIRLKKYPFTGYLTVVVIQGAFTFFLVYHGSSSDLSLQPPLLALTVASLLIGGFYPITQVYQHEADRKDGVTTLSYRLGVRGTFLYTGVVYATAMTLLYLYFHRQKNPADFWILATGMLPVIVYFTVWFASVLRDPSRAGFRNTMRMNWLASACTNAAFIFLIIKHQLE